MFGEALQSCRSAGTPPGQGEERCKGLGMVSLITPTWNARVDEWGTGVDPRPQQCWTSAILAKVTAAMHGYNVVAALSSRRLLR